MFKCGVAGWDYPSWKGSVYPARVPKDFDRLGYLARYLPVLEINRTYYRPASAAEATSWLERVADHPEVVLAAKIPEVFTAPGKAFGAADVKAAREGLDVLHQGGRLAAAVLQFAYSFKRLGKDGAVNQAALDWLGSVARAFDGLPVFAEFRHQSWDDPEVLALLRELGLGWVNVDQPHLPKDALRLTAHATTATGYLRLHGRNYQTWLRGQSKATAKTAENVAARQKPSKEQRAAAEAQKDAKFDYLYSVEELGHLADTARGIAAQPGVKSVMVVNNNHFVGKAPANALMMRGLLEGHPVAGPAELVTAFGPALGGLVKPG